MKEWKHTSGTEMHTAGTVVHTAGTETRTAGTETAVSKQKNWGGKPYHSFDYEMKQRFGGKVWKLSLQSGCSCPNRDGTLGTGGCIFCSEGGSGDFAASAYLPVREQIETAKARVFAKLPKVRFPKSCGADMLSIGSPADGSDAGGDGGVFGSGFAGYMAYFQSFTNTYGPKERLRKIFREALEPPDVLALSIGTRPDCLPDEMIGMLAELNLQKPVYVELGLQTIHERTAERIHRGYRLPVFEDTVRRLKSARLSVVVHLILGLPGESRADMEESVRYLASFKENGTAAIDGIKLQLLHILKGTVLGEQYMKAEQGLVQTLEIESFTTESYADFIIDLIELLPPEMTVHRLTGDAPKKLLLAPLWSADKKRVLNTLTRRFAERRTWQGRCFKTSVGREYWRYDGVH